MGESNNSRKKANEYTRAANDDMEDAHSKYSNQTKKKKKGKKNQIGIHNEPE